MEKRYRLENFELNIKQVQQETEEGGGNGSDNRETSHLQIGRERIEER